MKRYFTLLLLVVFFIPITVFAGAGRTGSVILNLGGGARATALGDAFSAMSGDVTTTLWNPSGLVNITKSNFQTERFGPRVSMYYKNQGDLFGEAGEGLYYTFITGALPLGNYGTIGTTVQMQGQGTSLVTTDSPDPIREENLGTNFVFTFSYADQITNRFTTGISAKMIRVVLGSEGGGSYSYAVDFGSQYRLSTNLLPTTLGLAIQNIGPKIHFIDENQADPLPALFRIGSATSLFQSKNNHVRLVTGLTARIDKWVEDESELELFIQTQNENGNEITREQALSDRGVGIRAFEWRHLEKSIGLEHWIANTVAFRIGHKVDPFAPNRTKLSDHFDDGFKFSDVGPFLLDLSDFFTYGIGVQVYTVKFDLTYGAVGLGPFQKRLLEVTAGLVF